MATAAPWECVTGLHSPRRGPSRWGRFAWPADLVIERDDGTLIAFEDKAASRVSLHDLTPMAQLRDATGPKFLAGIALHLGKRSCTYNNRLHVMPVVQIWTPPA